MKLLFALLFSITAISPLALANNNDSVIQNKIAAAVGEHLPTQNFLNENKGCEFSDQLTLLYKQPGSHVDPVTSGYLFTKRADCDIESKTLSWKVETEGTGENESLSQYFVVYLPEVGYDECRSK